MSKTDIINTNITEAKNITYLSYRDVGEDIHLVKEVEYKDGAYTDRINVIKNFKRPYWVTKELYRTHTDKKEAEDLKKVDIFYSTESYLMRDIPKRLGSRYIGVTDARYIKQSPYIYGTDIDSRTILKHKYLKASNNAASPNRIGVFDIEVNTITNEIIIISLITNKVLKLGILKSFVDNSPRYMDRIHDLYKSHIPDCDLKDQVDIEIKVFDKEIDMLKWLFHHANHCEIDVLTAWNIKYDLGEIVRVIEANGLKPEDVFHYEAIPDKYKYYKFTEGRSVKRTEAGREVALAPEDIWHSIKSSTNYFFIDAMSAHRYVRVGGATVPGGYSLDNILSVEGVAKKLKFDDNKKYKGLEWHRYMVKQKPIEYIVYNIWDVMSMLTMDNKTKDLSISMPLLLEVSHPDVFSSGPKCILNAMLFFYLQHGKVIGTRDPTSTNDKKLGLDNWVITLNSYMVEEKGLKCIIEDSNMNTNIKVFVGDLDFNGVSNI